jgi:hypothetical protein
MDKSMLSLFSFLLILWASVSQPELPTINITMLPILYCIVKRGVELILNVMMTVRQDP